LPLTLPSNTNGEEPNYLKQPGLEPS